MVIGRVKKGQLCLVTKFQKKLGLKIGDPFVLSTPKENSQEMRDSDFKVASIVTTGGKEED